MKKMTVKKYIGMALKVVLGFVVIVFLGSESLNFFEYVFPADQWYMAYTGFGLTSGAMLVYLYLFLWDAESPLQKTVALVMILVGILGELATAGFGMQVEAWAKQGISLTESDFDFMILAVRLLMFAHAIALVVYFAGDAIGNVFADDDKDGIPNVFDKDTYRKPQKPNSQPMRSFAAEEEKLPDVNPTSGQSPKE